MRHFLGLVVLTALAVVGAAAALMRGEVLFGVLFGAAAALATAQLIRRSLIGDRDFLFALIFSAVLLAAIVILFIIALGDRRGALSSSHSPRSEATLLHRISDAIKPYRFLDGAISVRRFHDAYLSRRRALDTDDAPAGHFFVGS
jgi:hypothetical protein